MSNGATARFPLPGRIYTVTDGDNERLVRTYSQAAALAHVARTRFAVAISTQDDLERLLSAGVRVEYPQGAEAEAAEEQPAMRECQLPESEGGTPD